MDDDLKNELTPNKSKALIDVREEWPWYARIGAYIVNAVPVAMSLVFFYYAISYFNKDPSLVHNRDVTLNITVWAVVIGILAEICLITIVSWTNPHLSYKRLRNSGSDLEKAACYIFWGLLAIAGAIIIAAGIR
jgi:hypothetical protein